MRSALAVGRRHSLRRALLGTTVVLLAVALVAGCEGCSAPPGLVDEDAGSVGEADAGPGCSVDQDCPLGEQCREGACVPATADVGDTGCTDDTDCNDGELCALSTGRCLPDAVTPDVPTGPPGPCATGEQRTCGIKMGACEYGVELCEAGAWSGVCLGGVAPVDEECNGVDDDCDTDTDEGFGAGAPCEDGLGACRQTGVTVCSTDGLSIVCTAEGLDPAGRVELCANDPDDDCDGEVNEGFGTLGAACTVGSGGCTVSGVWSCTADARALECVVPIDPDQELCDGVDNNSNSCVDEGFDLGSPCSVGAGQCARSGVTVCNGAGDGVQCNATAGAPQSERCNNLDDDCNTVVDNGCDDDGDDWCDAALPFDGSAGSVGVCPSSGPASLDCNDAVTAVNPGATEICNNSVDEDCDGSTTNGCAACSPTTDADFDGSNQCNDCDETNGAVHPGATERCDGLDQDCDGQIDESFDGDSDGYTTCGTVLPGGRLDPARVDCNDGDANIHPFGCELCRMGAAGAATCNQPNDRGTGADEDCDGFVDETCSPCDSGDGDNDGVTGCQGDCNNSDRAVYPGAAEVCDGKDTDCNRLTVENCEVGDPCNFAANTDECQDRLICVESLNAGGQRTGSYTCTSFCNLTSPGAGLGDSCDVDETCGAALTPTANLHGCARTTGFGARATGIDCDRDSDCRSGICLTDGRVTGGQRPEYCTDLCTHNDSCPNGTTCQAAAGSPSAARCLRVLSVQDLAVGATCTTANGARCHNGSASCADVGGQRRCREICCGDADCAGTERCALVGPTVANPNGGVDTVALCVPDSSGNGGRPAGAACTTSLQCESELCDVTLGVCIEPCCFDAMCPTGLLCESAIFELPSGSQTFARMCLNVTPSSPLEAR